jgi:hypothetical protein
MLDKNFKTTKPPQRGDEEYTGKCLENKVYTRDFGDGKGKYVSAVVDSEDNLTIHETSRTKWLATYIFNKDEVVGIKISQYKKKAGALLPNPVSINLSFKESCSLIDFVNFLSKADLKSVSAGKLELSDSLELNDDLKSKLITISKDPKGKKILEEFLNKDYLLKDEKLILEAVKLIDKIQDNESAKDSIKNLAEKSNIELTELIKIGLSPSKIKEKTTAINNFEDLINKSDVKEVADIQDALRKMPWIFGPEYESLDVRNAGDVGMPDARLKRIDGLSDILEVKLPNAELLREDIKNRQFIAPNLAAALGQLTGYLEHYYSEYRTEKEDATGVEILEDSYGRYYKPKGILLIGRRNKNDGTKTVKNTSDAKPKQLRRLLSYFNWIEILTYDDLIERARNGLKNLVN